MPGVILCLSPYFHKVLPCWSALEEIVHLHTQYNLVQSNLERKIKTICKVNYRFLRIVFFRHISIAECQINLPLKRLLITLNYCFM